MMSSDDDYVYDDESGEWIPASEMRAKQAGAAKADSANHPSVSLMNC